MSNYIVKNGKLVKATPNELTHLLLNLGYIDCITPAKQKYIKVIPHNDRPLAIKETNKNFVRLCRNV